MNEWFDCSRDSLLPWDQLVGLGGNRRSRLAGCRPCLRSAVRSGPPASTKTNEWQIKTQMNEQHSDVTTVCNGHAMNESGYPPLGRFRFERFVLVSFNEQQEIKSFLIESFFIFIFIISFQTTTYLMHFVLMHCSTENSFNFNFNSFKFIELAKWNLRWALQRIWPSCRVRRVWA